MNPANTGVDAPTVSIIILTKNGDDTIDNCLASVFDQEADSSYEVIVIDSGSTDRTLEILKGYSVRLKQIRPEEFNFGGTKNMGAKLARGQYLVYLSQDAIPIDRNWLRNLTKPLSDPEIQVVQGVGGSGEDGFFWWRNGLFWYTSEMRRWMERYHQIGLSCVAIAIRRKAWEKVKFEMVPFGEDKLFQKKVAEAGLKIVLAEDAVVEHTHRYTLRSLISRITYEGLGAGVSGESYSLRDMVRDVLNVQIYRHLAKGLRNGDVRSLAELLFPLIRPTCIYKGMHSSKANRA